jgi:2-C-methyl-D-erythritol 2,4-cyclodiphosphate synthase
MIRIGNGIDIHKLISGNGFLLGGVKIESIYSIEAHSDGDILYHAISDALLGAISYGDIGQHFPDNSDKTKDMNSEKIFLFCLEKVYEKGYKIANIDSTILLQKPKLMPHIIKIRENISNVSKLELNQISVKATTTEKLGYIGESRGIAVYSTVLIYKGQLFTNCIIYPPHR